MIRVNRHLKPEELMDAVEGLSLAAARQAHMDGCSSCRTRLQSMRSVQAGVFAAEDIPEPDWSEFRGSVRLALLSRSIQRESAVRRWTGWPIRPAMAWALGLVLTVGMASGIFLWNASHKPAGTTTQAVEPDSSVPRDSLELEIDVAGWSASTVFEEAAQLDSVEVEHLRRLLESAEKEPIRRQ